MSTNFLPARLLARLGLGLALFAIGLAASPPVYAGWHSLTGLLPAHTYTPTGVPAAHHTLT